MAQASQPATPQPAATVVLTRPDGAGGFEIFMNRRPEKMDVYAGIYVFPGGRVEAADRSAAMLQRVRGVTPTQAQAALGSDAEPEHCLAFWIAAVRELFEEVGVHFFAAQSGAGEGSQLTPMTEQLAGRRVGLQQGDEELASLLDAERLVCDLARLRYFFHRITPEHYPVRFDTRFYLAALPDDQEPLSSSEEVSESLWIAPQAALERTQAGGFPMLPPTVAVLKTLASHDSWQSLCAAYNLR